MGAFFNHCGMLVKKGGFFLIFFWMDLSLSFFSFFFFQFSFFLEDSKLVLM